MTAGRRAAAVCALIVGMLLSPVVLAGAHAADETPDDTGNLSVVVTGETPTPTTSASTPVTGPKGGVNGAGGGLPAGNSGPGAAAPGEVSIAGMLYLGGLTSAVALSPDPAQGDVTLSFTLRNASQSTIDATADFWIDTALLPIRVDTVDDVAIAALEPGESRVVTAQLHNAGQWTLLNAHVTLTPPETVDGTALSPATRDALVFVFPWLVAAVVALGLIGFFVFRAIRAMVLVPAIADAA